LLPSCTGVERGGAVEAGHAPDGLGGALPGAPAQISISRLSPGAAEADGENTYEQSQVVQTPAIKDEQPAQVYEGRASAADGQGGECGQESRPATTAAAASLPSLLKVLLT